jgi:hypothetical protein
MSFFKCVGGGLIVLLFSINGNNPPSAQAFNGAAQGQTLIQPFSANDVFWL